MTVFANSIMEVMQKANNVKNKPVNKDSDLEIDEQRAGKNYIWLWQCLYRISENNIKDFSFSVLEYGIKSKLLD